MKLRLAAIAFSATLVACGGGAGGVGGVGGVDGDLDADDVPLIGGGDVTDEDDLIDGLTDGEGDAFADGCEGASGTDLDSSTADWDDNCRLQRFGEHATSSYTQGVQRIIFCRGNNGGLDIAAINNFADGTFGPMTEEQVRNFQTSQNIDSDGIVGPETWGALQDVLEIQSMTDSGDADIYSVVGGICSGVPQFHQERLGTAPGGWTMTATLGSPITVPFSVGPPQ